MALNIKKQTDYENYASAVESFKRKNKGIITNLYLLSDKLGEDISSKRNMLAVNEDCIFLLLMTRNAFWRIYYTAKDIDALSSMLCDFARDFHDPIPLVCDIIGKRVKVTPEADVFLKNGFTLRRRLARADTTARRTKRLPGKLVSDVEFAKPEDAPELLDMLESEFDIYSQQVPDRKEILEEIAARRVVVIRRDGCIAAFECFQINGAVFWGRFSFVREPYRKEFLYYSIFECIRGLIEEQCVKKAFSWIDEDNAALLKGRIKGGDVIEDMVDYVLMYSNDKN